MSGPTTPGSPPPEVPEEFAAAYRAAYEQALAAQTGGAQHRDVPDTDELDAQPLPRRKGPLRIGTHRSAEVYEHDEDYGATWYERIRDLAWFVPFLLTLLTLLLILGAYAVGRRFADQVEGGSSVSEPRAVFAVRAWPCPGAS